jgi:hypothetical protein
MYCKTCGTLLNDDDTICGVCSTVVTQQKWEAPEGGSVDTGAIQTEESPVGSAWPWTETGDAPILATDQTSAVLTDETPVTAVNISETAGDDSISEKKIGAGDKGDIPPPRKFDFNWDSQAFHAEARAKNEEVDFKWEADALSQMATISAAAREKAMEEAVTKRAEDNANIFMDDTFHLRTNPDDESRFMFSKKNEEFQELLDEEFEKIRSKQIEINEERNQIKDDVMDAPVATPKVLVTGENARKTAEERIAEFLQKADREMLEAIDRRVKEQINEIDRDEKTARFAAPEQEETKDTAEPIDGETSQAAEWTQKEASRAAALAWDGHGDQEAAESEPFTVEDIMADKSETVSGTKKVPVVSAGLGMAGTPNVDTIGGVGGGLFGGISPGLAEYPIGTASDIAGISLFKSGVASPIVDTEKMSSKGQDEREIVSPIDWRTDLASPFRKDLTPAEADGESTVFEEDKVLPTYVPYNDKTLKVPDIVNQPVVFPFDEDFADIGDTEEPIGEAIEQSGDIAEADFDAQVEEAFKMPDAEETEDISELGEEAVSAENTGEDADTEVTEEPIVEAIERPGDIAEAAFDAQVEAAFDVSDAEEAEGIPEAAEEVTTAEPEPEVQAEEPTATESETQVAEPIAAEPEPETDTEERTESAELAPDESAESAHANEEKNEKKKRKKLKVIGIIIVDIFVILAVLVVSAFAILKFAPDSGIAELIGKGVNKITTIYEGMTSKDEIGSDEDMNIDPDLPADDGGVVAPLADKDTLVASQLYNNYNIKNVAYDGNAAYVAGVEYPFPGAAESLPIENNYWTADEAGRVLYDEAAVATIIRYNSALIDYINNGQDDVLGELEKGSEAEEALTVEVAALEHLEINMLGIGEIRQNGNDFFVWTIETVTEIRNGAAATNIYKKLYRLMPDISMMKVSGYATIS